MDLDAATLADEEARAARWRAKRSDPNYGTVVALLVARVKATDTMHRIRDQLPSGFAAGAPSTRRQAGKANAARPAVPDPVDGVQRPGGMW